MAKEVIPPIVRDYLQYRRKAKTAPVSWGGRGRLSYLKRASLAYANMLPWAQEMALRLEKENGEKA